MVFNNPFGFDQGRRVTSVTLAILNFLRLLMRTFIYIDGFNFYYGAVKNTPYKWLDFKSLFQKLLNPNNQIIEIKYFTALVSGKYNPQKPIKQKTFFTCFSKLYSGNENILRAFSNSRSRCSFS